MSLDVYLKITACDHCGSEERTVYEDNITHNLGFMASIVDLYKVLWHPGKLGVVYARELIKPLKAGLSLLYEKPTELKPYNPENGWGDYDDLVEFVEKYLEACERYPKAKVDVSV